MANSRKELIKGDVMESCLLNVGCGNSYNKEWVNLDFNSKSPYVKKHDIRKGIPYGDNSFDAVYSSHMLEHLNIDEADYFVKEAYRILKKNGVIRIAVPDLESIALDYINSLNNVREEYSQENEANYDWMMIELFDQVVRNHSGGMTRKYLEQDVILNKDFIKYRIGNVAVAFWDKQEQAEPPKKNLYRSIRRIVGKIFRKYNIPPFNENYFRKNSGEIHRWMYDSFSLNRLMRKHGFSEVAKRDFNRSDILDFARYELESADGKERKSDSLYMEGRK